MAEIVEQIPIRKEIFLMGDMNARVGKEENSKVIGQHGEAVRNGNGERLIDLCTQMNLQVSNTFFCHRKIHKYT